MTPAQLRAQAALWALRAALVLLDQRIVEEDRAIREEYRAAAEPLRSPTYGTRTALGGHGDPTSDALDAISAVAVRTNRWADLRAEVWGQLRDVAQHLPGLAGPLDRLHATVPHMSDRMAAATRLLADRIDGRIRRLLGEVDDRQLVPRARCPLCDAAGLVLRTSASLDQQVVECTTCDGAWTRDDVWGRAACPS